MAVFSSTSLAKETDLIRKNWPGYSVLGNGRLSVVYSDDERVSRGIRREGIQHLYYQTFQADYINSTSFDILDANGNPFEEDTSLERSVGMANFCTTSSTRYLRNEAQPATPIEVETQACAHLLDAVILRYDVNGAREESHYVFRARVPERVGTSPPAKLTRAESRGSEAIFGWGNGTILVAGTLSGSGGVVIDSGVLTISGLLRDEPVQIVIAIGKSDIGALKTNDSISKGKLRVARMSLRNW